MPAGVLASSACAANRLMKCAVGSAITTSSSKRSRTSASSTMRCCGRTPPRQDVRGRTVIETRRAQRSFGDGLIADEVKGLHEEWMKHADRVLADKEIVAVVYEALAKRHPRTAGHPGRGGAAFAGAQAHAQLELRGAGTGGARRSGVSRLHPGGRH